MCLRKKAAPEKEMSVHASQAASGFRIPAPYKHYSIPISPATPKNFTFSQNLWLAPKELVPGCAGLRPAFGFAGRRPAHPGVPFLLGAPGGGLDAERAKLLINKTFRHFMALYYAVHYRGFALLTPGYLAFAASRFLKNHAALGRFVGISEYADETSVLPERHSSISFCLFKQNACKGQVKPPHSKGFAAN
jgi:hypothetical protein